MKRLTQQALTAALEAHALFLKGDPNGVRADFSKADLRGRDLSRRDLRQVDFDRANATDADFSGSNLRGSTFRHATLVRADFSGCQMDGCDLSWSDMSNANTSEADFGSSDMTGAVLSSTPRRASSGIDPGLFGFPHPYQSVFYGAGTDGYPLWEGGIANSAGSFRMDRLARLAKFPYVEIPQPTYTQGICPWVWPVVKLIKNFSAACRVAYYWQGQYRLKGNFEATRMNDQLWALALGPPERRLFNLNGAPLSHSFPFDALVPSDCYHDMAPVTAQTIAIWRAFTGGPNFPVDGLHIDWAVYKPSSGQTNPPGTVDFTSAGYASAAALDAANTVAMRALFTAMQGLGYRVVGNRGSANPNYTADTDAYTWDGELFENWDPDDGFAGGTAPILTAPTYDGAMARVEAWRGPTPSSDGKALIKSDFLNSPAVNTPEWNKLCRYTLGSATIMGSYAFMDGQSNYGAGEPPCMWVADEYSVTPAGATDITMNNMGWMGRPTEYGFKDPTQTGLWVRRFERGAVIVNGDGPGPATRSYTMERPYRRIQGVFDPTINNGTTATTFAVPKKDAIFLLRT